METDPWKMINNLFPDLVFLVEGKKLYFHQAVVAQHSVLVKSLLLKNSCCKCFGVDCSRNAGNVFITIDGVKIDTVQYVMDLVYSGSGSIAGDTEDYKSVIDMLQIDTILLGDIEAPLGFNMEEIVSDIGSETELDSNQEAFFNSDALDEESRKVDEQLRETNKALKKLEKEKKKLALEEKKKQEIQRKTDRRKRNKVPNYVEEESRDGMEGIEEPVKPEKSEVKEKIPTQTINVPVDKKEAVSTTMNVSKSNVTSNKSKPESSSKSNPNDDDCEVIALDDSISEVKNTSTPEVHSEEIERYVCPFKDCRSESKNAQSIKVHLALVHYKKTIQSEFPNWKKQKCDECDKSFGQMTAYYLHMANHKKYQYMDLPAHAMKPKDDQKKVNIEKVTQQVPLKPTNSPAIRSSAPMSITRSSSPQVAQSTRTNPTRTSGAIIKPANIMPPRSNSFVQSRTVNQASKSSSFTAMRSKSFVQTKSQPQTPTTSKLQSLVRNPSSSGSTSSFGRPAPPGPPGPPTRSSNVFSRSSGPVISTNNKNQANPPVNHQRRLSAPYSVVHKRTNSVDKPASKDTKKTRGS